MGTLRKLPGFKEPVLIDEVTRVTRQEAVKNAEKANENKVHKGNKGFEANQSHTGDSHAHAHECVNEPHTWGDNDLVTLVTLAPTSNGAGLRLQGSETEPCNPCTEHPQVARFHPPPGSIVARITAAGGATSIAGKRPDGSLFKHGWLPAGTDPAFVAELHASGWTTRDRAENDAYVAECWRRAQIAVSKPEDADCGEVDER